MLKTPEEIADLEAHILTLIQKYGSRRAVLHRKDKIAEEVWIVFTDDIGMHRYASTSSYNEMFLVRLLNRPNAFADKDWGDQIKVRTNRSMKPYAHEFENMPEPIVAPDDPPAWPDYYGY